MMERITDPIDFAADLTARECAAGVARVKAAVAPSRAFHCRDCGDDLTPERRHAAPFSVRCAECQGVFEGGRR